MGHNPTLSTSQESCTNDVQKKSILVAEDIDSNYMLVKALLKTSELTRAYTGKEAVELASSHHYDAILMDMKMPVMGGLEATREIRYGNSYHRRYCQRFRVRQRRSHEGRMQYVHNETPQQKRIERSIR